MAASLTARASAGDDVDTYLRVRLLPRSDPDRDLDFFHTLPFLISNCAPPDSPVVRGGLVVFGLVTRFF